jgi:hypothetical protein
MYQTLATRSDWQSFLQVLEKLDRGEIDISNEQILLCFKQFAASIVTNCDCAAQAYFGAIAPICRQRPELERELIKKALLPLVYLEITNSEDALKWVSWYSQQTKPYFGRTSDEGILWLRYDLPLKEELIQELINEILKEEKEDSLE